MINPDAISEKIDGTTFTLSLIGLIPYVGEIVKDQIQAHIASVEQDRINECISQVRAQIGELKSRPLTTEQKKQIDNLCVTTFQRVRAEGIAEKRLIFSDILAQTILINLEPARMDWFQRSIDRLSMMSIDVLRALSEQSPTQRTQLHSHSGIMAQLETKYTYSFLVAMLRELEAVGILDIHLDQSSIQSGNARFTLFFKTIGNDFIRFIHRRHV